MPKLNQSIESTTLDKEGNLITYNSHKVLSWGSEPPYIKLYLQDILYLSDMPKHHEKILFELLKRSTYAGDRYGMSVSLSAGTKRIIASTLDIKNIRSINNVLSDLVKGEILYRIETGVYQFNPHLFGKGDWQDISKMRVEIGYNKIEGRTFKTMCNYNDKGNK